jgi:hypothetical protein
LSKSNAGAILKVATGYLVVSWLVLEIGHTLFNVFELPHAGLQFVFVLLALGFPIALRGLAGLVRDQFATRSLCSGGGEINQITPMAGHSALHRRQRLRCRRTPSIRVRRRASGVGWRAGNRSDHVYGWVSRALEPTATSSLPANFRVPVVWGPVDASEPCAGVRESRRADGGRESGGGAGGVRRWPVRFSPEAEMNAFQLSCISYAYALDCIARDLRGDRGMRRSDATRERQDCGCF